MTSGSKDSVPDLTYVLDPTLAHPEPKVAGVQVGWLVIAGGVGPGVAMKAQMLHDGQGGWDIVPDGEFEPVTIVDDRTPR